MENIEAPNPFQNSETPVINLISEIYDLNINNELYILLIGINQ